MKIYLDACAINRLTDDQSQPRIREEAEAVESILELVRQNRIRWIASSVLETELQRNPDMSRRFDSLDILSHASIMVRPGPSAVLRAKALASLGYGVFDAFHLAVAEQEHADSFLTTDDRLLRRAQRREGNPSLLVENPINWLTRTGPWAQ